MWLPLRALDFPPRPISPDDFGLHLSSSASDIHKLADNRSLSFENILGRRELSIGYNFTALEANPCDSIRHEARDPLPNVICLPRLRSARPVRQQRS